MTLNGVKLRPVVTFMKQLTSVVSSIFQPKSFIWNKVTPPPSNLLNFAELVENELMKNISKKVTNTSLFLSNLSLLIVKILRAYN